jgi:serine protease Do
VPAERIEELLAGAGVENTVSPTTLTYRAGIRAFFDGDRELAVSSLRKVLDEQPANGLAEKYLAKAEKLPKPAPEEDSSTWILVGGGAAAAGILGGGTLLALVLRRRGRRTAPAVSAVPAPGFPGAAVPPMPAAQQWPEQVPAREPVLVGAGAPVPEQAPVQPVVPAPSAPVGFTSHAPSYAGSGSASSCLTCGHPVEPGMAFCGRCGTRAGGAA